MIIIAKPKKESEILATTNRKTRKKRIIKEMAVKAQCCVDHLCGCR
jgi:hypothetical protein